MLRLFACLLVCLFACLGVCLFASGLSGVLSVFLLVVVCQSWLFVSKHLFVCLLSVCVHTTGCLLLFSVEDFVLRIVCLRLIIYPLYLFCVC